MNLNFYNDNLFWVHEPKSYSIGENGIVIPTDAGTGFWHWT